MTFRALATSLLAATLATVTWAQFDIPGLGGLPSIGGISIDSFLKQKEAITTSFKDATRTVPFLDFYDPHSSGRNFTWGNKVKGNWKLAPGINRGLVQTFCLHAGTYGPTKGEGYCIGPMTGDKADVVNDIITQYGSHPEVTHEHAQLLIWAIQAHVKFSSLDPEIQAAGKSLLTSKQIFDLNGGVVGAIPPDVMDTILGKLNESARPIFDAENKIRAAVTVPGVDFSQVEAAAVLDPATRPANAVTIPRTRWSLTQGGYFQITSTEIYTRTDFTIYMPEQFGLETNTDGLITKLSDGRVGIELKYGATTGRQTPIQSISVHRLGMDKNPLVLSNPGRVDRDEKIESVAQANRDLIDYVTKNHLSPPDPESRAKLSSLTLLQVALNAGIGPEVQNSQLKDVVTRAWASCFADCCSNSKHFRTFESHRDLLAMISRPDVPPIRETQLIDPWGTYQRDHWVLIPADGGTQRLGISDTGVSDEGPWTLTLYATGPSDHSSVGHAWVQLQDGDRSTTLGFYPASELGLFGLGDAGIFFGDADTPYQVRRSYTISDRNHFLAAYNAIDNWDMNYNIATHNCTDFARWVVMSGGVSGDDLPPQGIFSNPSDYVDWLLAHGGEPPPSL